MKMYNADIRNLSFILKNVNDLDAPPKYFFLCLFFKCLPTKRKKTKKKKVLNGHVSSQCFVNKRVALSSLWPLLKMQGCKHGAGNDRLEFFF
jgi:hypothetical protein